MSKPDQQSKVTLEDLLRLKRAERPRPDFWSNFEQELRQKQLTALVQKRRWWHEVPVLLNRRIYVPAGAAAIIAFTAVSVRYSIPGHIAQIPNLAPRVSAADPSIGIISPAEAIQPTQSQTSRYEEATVRASERTAEVPSTVLATTVIKSLPRDDESPPAHPLAAGLSRLEQPESDLVDSALGSRLSPPVRVQSAAATQSEVAAMTPASTTKYQLIARYAERSLSPAPAAPAVVR